MTKPLAPIGRRSLLAAAVALPLLPAGRIARAEAVWPRPFSMFVVQSGHSLTDPIIWPLVLMVEAVALEESRLGRIDASTVPGSPMDWRWEKSADSHPDVRKNMGDYDILIVTERAHVSSTMGAHRSEEMALLWYELARTKGSGGRGADTVLYATWVSLKSGPGNTDENDIPEERTMPFRDRLIFEMKGWQRIADYVNTNRPAGSSPMQVIPGPLILAAVYDAIEAGTAPGLTSIRDLFEDDIHLNKVGAYLIALAHFAVIYRRDPRIVPPQLPGFPGPSRETAMWMKDLVAGVLRDYPDAGMAGVL